MSYYRGGLAQDWLMSEVFQRYHLGLELGRSIRRGSIYHGAGAACVVEDLIVRYLSFWSSGLNAGCLNRRIRLQSRNCIEFSHACNHSYSIVSSKAFLARKAEIWVVGIFGSLGLVRQSNVSNGLRGLRCSLHCRLASKIKKWSLSISSKLPSKTCFGSDSVVADFRW